jgi:hypothetical protein
MKERWTEVEAGAKEKQANQFATWLSGESISFEDSKAAMVYKDRINLLKDAIQLIKPPNRVPVCPSPGFFPIGYAGSTLHEAMYEYEHWSGSGRNTALTLRPMPTTRLPVLFLGRSLIFWISLSTSGPAMVSPRSGLISS